MGTLFQFFFSFFFPLGFLFHSFLRKPFELEQPGQRGTEYISLPVSQILAANLHSEGLLKKQGSRDESTQQNYFFLHFFFYYFTFKLKYQYANHLTCADKMSMTFHCSV